MVPQLLSLGTQQGQWYRRIFGLRQPRLQLLCCGVLCLLRVARLARVALQGVAEGEVAVVRFLRHGQKAPQPIEDKWGGNLQRCLEGNMSCKYFLEPLLRPMTRALYEEKATRRPNKARLVRTGICTRYTVAHPCPLRKCFKICFLCLVKTWLL